MRILVPIALLMVCAVPAWAEIAISQRDCERLVNHEPAPDVEYQPGVDVHGRPVVPADLNGGNSIELPDVIYIPIEVFVKEKYNIPANSVLFNARAQVGVVEVHGDRVYYEDQLLGDHEVAALEDACRERQ